MSDSDNDLARATIARFLLGAKWKNSRVWVVWVRDIWTDERMLRFKNIME